MPQLLVWDPLDQRPAALAQAFGAIRGPTRTWTTDASVVDAVSGGAGPTVLLVLLRAAPTAAESAVIERFASRHHVAALLSRPSPDVVRELVSRGVRDVFAEPIVPSRILGALTLRLQGLRGPCAAATVPMLPVDPVVCAVRTFGGAAPVSGRWSGVASGAFELAGPSPIAEGTILEVDAAPPSLVIPGSLFGRVVAVEEPTGGPARLRCEALPVSDRSPLSLASRSGAATPEPVSLAPRREPLRLQIDPAIVGAMVVVLLVMAFLGWMAVRQGPTPAGAQPASRQAVLDGIQHAFEDDGAPAER
ncbi:MAG: hypothetical protein R3F59_00285 [Myxococcota bacterium]